MKFGICGYGNLGKAVEKVVKTNQDQIVGIFSRRKDVKSELGTQVFDYQDAKNFVGKIDVMVMCGGSQEDLLWQSPQMCKYFNIIDTFDTHASIQSHRQALDKVAKESGHVAIYSCGWDPGLFSMIRGLSNGVFKTAPKTFWGKGVSQGHSEALRNIPGILDAIQFTVPNSEAIKKCQSDPLAEIDGKSMHERHCFVALDGTRNFEDIQKQIKETENYFKGQKVIVNVCSPEEIQDLKKKMFHQGVVFAGDKDSSLEFSVKMQNNPLFTAKILYAYSNAIKKLESGAYNPTDIPVKYLEKNDNFKKLI